jgi:hypothetical protein
MSLDPSVFLTGGFRTNFLEKNYGIQNLICQVESGCNIIPIQQYEYFYGTMYYIIVSFLYRYFMGLFYIICLS